MLPIEKWLMLSGNSKFFGKFPELLLVFLFENTSEKYILQRYFLSNFCMHAYEIEIKVLLGTKASRDSFMEAVSVNFPAVKHSYTESQKNHYFE